MANLSELVHLTSSSEEFQTVLEGSANDDAQIWVSTDFERLVGQKADLSIEYQSRLNAARAEFSSALKQLEELVGIAWSQSERYQGPLRLISVFPADCFEDENTWTWGSQWYPGAKLLNVNPPILFHDILRRGVLARDAAILLSPRILDALPRHFYEQSEYLAYRMFERKNDKEFWVEARHGLRKQTRFRSHDLIDFFQFREMMVGDSLYRDLWLRLKELGTSQLTSTDYFNIFSSLSSRPIVPGFDKSELSLLKLLSKRPEVGAGEAARLLGISIPTAMKAIRELSAKAGLSFTILVDMQKIGLVEYLVPLRTPKQSDVLRLLSRFPYCRQVFRIYGSYDLFTVIDIPKEHESFMPKFFAKMVEGQLVSEFRSLRLERDLHSVNFDRYDEKASRWDIHWDSWGVAVREALKKDNAWQQPLQSRPERMRIDRLDLVILSSLQVNCRTPFSTIARTLGVSGAYVGRRVAKMAAEGLFRYGIWPLKIGAEDWGLLALSCSNHVATTLASSLSQLPAWRGGLVTGDVEGMLSIVWCPNGELKQFFKAIDDTLIRTGLARAECLNSIGEWLLARWLPIDPDTPWNLFSEDGKWLFDEQRYLSMVD